MGRLFAAVREWLQLRVRIREERRFHLDSAAAELRALGLSSRAARHEARSRFGGRRNLKLALRELGGDAPGFIFLLRAHRVTASLWLQPAILLAAIGLILSVSPSPRKIVKGVIGQPPLSVDLGVVFVSAHGRPPWGITPAEFEALRSMTTVTNVEPYRGLYARGRRARGATLDAIQAEAGLRTGHSHLWAVPLSGRTELEMSPAWMAWVLIALYGVFFLLTHARRTLRGRWLLYKGRPQKGGFWTHGCQKKAEGGDGMTLKHYFPISVAAFILIVVGAYHASLPVIPFIVLTLVGETLLGFQFEDHKALRFLETVWKAIKPAH